MDKLQELVKEGKLSENLMKDKEFVEGAKEIFKSENVEVSDEKLKQLIKEIENKLKTNELMSDEELENVSGGINAKSTAVMYASMFACSALGGVLGAGIVSGIAGGISVAATGADIKKTMKDPNSPTSKAMSGGGIVGGASGAAGGLVLGYKLGKYICDKCGLEKN